MGEGADDDENLVPENGSGIGADRTGVHKPCGGRDAGGSSER
jgi:hypothetical protein